MEMSRLSIAFMGTVRVDLDSKTRVDRDLDSHCQWVIDIGFGYRDMGPDSYQLQSGFYESNAGTRLDSYLHPKESACM